MLGLSSGTRPSLLSQPAPLILRTPPFHSRVPALGEISSRWADIAPLGQSHDAPDHPVARQLNHARVGGAFWGAVPVLAVNAGSLLIPPQAAGRTACEIDFRGIPKPVWFGDSPPSGVTSVARSVDPHALLDQIGRVILLPAAEPNDIVVLALLRGLPVHRAGQSEPEDPARALALLVSATRYQDPFSGREIDAGTAISLLADWRDLIRRNRHVSALVGMAWWKRRRMGEFFARAEPSRGGVRFRRSVRVAVRLADREKGDIAVWSSRVPPRLLKHANSKKVRVLRVEDGFIRSLGLGSALLPPSSVVVDGRGLYLDPRQPSDLEIILATHPFDPSLKARAEELARKLIQGNISKYAAGDLHAPDGTAFPAERRVALVVGQVADDLSVRLGGGEVDGMLDLLRRVRAEEPDAYLVFRPHPDVDAGFRLGAIEDADALRFADQVSRGGSITALLDRVNVLHTLTSLAGFEAVIRGVPVVCWGQPFYAGWGLTEDRAPIARRRRTLSREELVAGCLVVYPRYCDPVTKLPCGPETVIDRLLDPQLWKPSVLTRLRTMQGLGVKRWRALGANGFARARRYRSSV